MTSNKDELFKAVLEQMPEGMIIIDENDRIVFVNRTAEEIRRISKEQIIGRNVIYCHPEKSQERIKRALHFLKKEESKAFKRMVTDKKGERYYENTYSVIRDNNDNCIGSIVISKDITDLKKLEEERADHLQNLLEKVGELKDKLQDIFISSMTSLVNSLEAKDPYTKGHSLRVSTMAATMTQHIWGFSPEAREVALAGILHDIGKVGVREMILNKAGRLTDEEFDHIKEHPIIGEKILMPIKKIESVTKVVRHHHERFDGKGYPDGLKREEIPVGSRILAIVDSYDAMTSTRPYGPPMNPEKAAEEIKRNLGTQFDPKWGEIFSELFYSGSIG